MKLRAAAALFALSLTPAMAGDAATLNVIGFSGDGTVFAFEEYGTQDGSGFPYANRFYIETATDSFVKGTPIRVRLDDEAKSETDARAEARAKANALAGADDSFEPGFVVASNAITEESADPHRFVASPGPFFPPIMDSIGVRLEEIDVPIPENCKQLDNPVKGFRLVRFDPKTSADIAVLHEDKRIPESRTCPFGYRLANLSTQLEQGGRAGQFAVVIAVRSQGFEGPNHRFIAVPGKLNPAGPHARQDGRP